MIRKGIEVLNDLRLSKREWIFIGCTVVLLVLFTANLVQQNMKHQNADPTVLNPSQSSPPLDTSNTQPKLPKPAPVQKKKIVVDVKGEVKTPGVYAMTEGDRVLDAVKRAGGLTNKADRNLINLAKRLQDEMVVYVPKKGEKPSEIPNVAEQGTNDPSGMPANGKVKINTANETELEALPGIGPVTAKAIIAYRKKHGPFKNANDLTKVPGIGKKTVNAFKASISFQG